VLKTLMALIDGLPASPARPTASCRTTALYIENGQIAAIYTVRNPDKLKHLH